MIHLIYYLIIEKLITNIYLLYVIRQTELESMFYGKLGPFMLLQTLKYFMHE